MGECDNQMSVGIKLMNSGNVWPASAGKGPLAPSVEEPLPSLTGLLQITAKLGAC